MGFNSGFKGLIERDKDTKTNVQQLLK